MSNSNDKTLPISYGKAAKLISNINSNKDTLNGHPVLENNAGGTFKARKIKEWLSQDTFSGIMCWYCLKGDDFFIAIEPCFNYTYDESDLIVKRPTQKNLLIPKKLIKENLYAESNLDKKLPQYKHGVLGKQKTASNEEVSGWVENYFNSEKCFSRFSYFIGCYDNENLLKKFIEEKNPKNIRYFFSYDTDDLHSVYPLRVILAPVNGSGRNINKSGGKDVAVGDALQYSWPPKH